jgi:hypothetical protein
MSFEWRFLDETNLESTASTTRWLARRCGTQHYLDTTVAGCDTSHCAKS